MKGRPVAALPTEAFFSNVPYNTSEEHLREIFSTAGEVANLQLFRKNGESRGMGVVTFLDPESVQRAVQMLRDAEVGDRKMWVSTHNRSPELERGGAAPPVPMTTSSKVFFSNVPFDVGEEQLQMLFSEVGIVTELTLFTGKEGHSRGMGHCTFQVPSQAAAAIKVLRDRDVGGRPIWIAEDVKSSQLQAQTVGTVPMVSMVAPVIPQVSPVPFLAATMGAPIASIGHTGHVPHASSGRIFFGNVPFDVTDAQLEQLFRSIGPITDLHLMRTADGKSRGMGHVTYQTPELAALAIQQLLDRDVGGRPILVKEDRSTAPHPAVPAAPVPMGPVRSATPVTRGPPPNEAMATSSRVFFSNVPYTVSEAELLSLFRQVGSVLELNLFQNELGRSRGMGHCLFQSPQEAQLAIQELRDVDVGGRPIWIAEDSRGKTPLSGKGGKGAGKGPMGAMHLAQPY